MPIRTALAFSFLSTTLLFGCLPFLTYGQQQAPTPDAPPAAPQPGASQPAEKKASEPAGPDGDLCVVKRTVGRRRRTTR